MAKSLKKEWIPSGNTGPKSIRWTLMYLFINTSRSIYIIIYFPPLSNMLQHILQMKVSFICLLKTQLLHYWNATQLWCQMRHQNTQQGTEHKALVNVPLRVIRIKSTPEQIFKSAIHPFHIIIIFIFSSQATLKPEVPLNLQNSLDFRPIT